MNWKRHWQIESPPDCCYKCHLTQPVTTCHLPLKDLHYVFNSDILEDICAFLYPTELKHLGYGAKFLREALKTLSDDVQWRLQNMVRWYDVGGGARICKRDDSVAFSTGKWSPGGVAVADLQITSDCNVSFRFEVTFQARRGGDVLFGLTRRSKPDSADDSPAMLAAGYEYILGRGLAPASLFIGTGSARQCGFSRGDGTGPIIDSRSPGKVPGLRCPGHFMELQCRAGFVIATDFAGKQFQWSTTIKETEIWQPTFAWTGSTASIRIVRQD